MLDERDAVVAGPRRVTVPVGDLVVGLAHRDDDVGLVVGVRHGHAAERQLILLVRHERVVERERAVAAARIEVDLEVVVLPLDRLAPDLAAARKQLCTRGLGAGVGLLRLLSLGAGTGCGLVVPRVEDLQGDSGHDQQCDCDDHGVVEQDVLEALR